MAKSKSIDEGILVDDEFNPIDEHEVEEASDSIADGLVKRINTIFPSSTTSRSFLANPIYWALAGPNRPHPNTPLTSSTSLSNRAQF